jgi:hypothetical protein
MVDRVAVPVVVLGQRVAPVYPVREPQAVTAAVTTAAAVVVLEALEVTLEQVRAALLAPVRVSLAAHTPLERLAWCRVVRQVPLVRPTRATVAGRVAVLVKTVLPAAKASSSFGTRSKGTALWPTSHK